MSGVVVAVDWGSGALGDIPVPRDHDGDGRADTPSGGPRIAGGVVPQGVWYVIRSSALRLFTIIQLVDEPAGLCLAVGHSRRGFCYAGGTGRLVAELLTGKPPFLPAGAFRFERFDTGEAHAGA